MDLVGNPSNNYLNYYVNDNKKNRNGYLQLRDYCKTPNKFSKLKYKAYILHNLKKIKLKNINIEDEYHHQNNLSKKFRDEFGFNQNNQDSYSLNNVEYQKNHKNEPIKNRDKYHSICLLRYQNCQRSNPSNDYIKYDNLNENLIRQKKSSNYIGDNLRNNTKRLSINFMPNYDNKFVVENEHPPIYNKISRKENSYNSLSNPHLNIQKKFKSLLKKIDNENCSNKLRSVSTIRNQQNSFGSIKKQFNYKELQRNNLSTLRRYSNYIGNESNSQCWQFHDDSLNVDLTKILKQNTQLENCNGITPDVNITNNLSRMKVKPIFQANRNSHSDFRETQEFYLSKEPNNFVKCRIKYLQNQIIYKQNIINESIRSFQKHDL